MHAYDRAIALGPEAYIYLNRSLRRPKADLAGRRADLDAALELDPNLTEAIARKADLQTESGDLTGAISTYSPLLRSLQTTSRFLWGVASLMLAQVKLPMLTLTSSGPEGRLPSR
jgi:Tfp pilus assembly protein PilF